MILRLIEDCSAVLQWLLKMANNEYEIDDEETDYRLVKTSFVAASQERLHCLGKQRTRPWAHLALSSVFEEFFAALFTIGCAMRRRLQQRTYHCNSSCSS